MDKFALSSGLIGLAFGLLGLALLVFAVVRTWKKKMRLNSLVQSVFLFLLFSAVGAACVFLSLFVQTFHRLTYEERLGTVAAVGEQGVMDVRFEDAASKQRHVFELKGDQWMVEGYILRWKPFLRFLGAGLYYKVTRFSGRWEDPAKPQASHYQLAQEPGYWKFMMKHAGKKLPLVDAVYGIGAFQYPSERPYDLLINDTGFIIKPR
ncbi:MAG TPA: hypothetical protein DDW31_02930 [candidate division Zixibacteria bacterium]|jgi:hypothetical protein|nr:hypothetical protein [candidate division Zixibacteria bacterium]